MLVFSENIDKKLTTVEDFALALKTVTGSNISDEKVLSYFEVLVYNKELNTWYRTQFGHHHRIIYVLFTGNFR